MNEPLVTSWVHEGVPQREEHIQIIWTFVHDFCGMMKKLDAMHSITVNVSRAAYLSEIRD